MDLRAAPADFFTRDLDEAVLRGSIDTALHSAKDLPDPLPAGLDWFWLPWAEDPRDCLVLAPGRPMTGLPLQPRIGVSSVRRETYCRQRFPTAVLAPVRGTIEERLRQLERGDFDLLVMAGAALLRLDLADRIAEWIPAAALAPPDGQGFLALTFRRGDARCRRLRSLFVKAVVFAGAGAGDAALCTLAAVDALRHCQACLYDALLDSRLLDELPAGARVVAVGKRAGHHLLAQAAIAERIADYARRGWRVVRLKGGDPGLFSRLTEELGLLDDLHLPYRVIPGVSSLLAATTGTGMLLTRRGVARGFCAMTPRSRDGERAPVGGAARASLPAVFFMASGLCREIMDELQRDGTPADTPAAAVFDAGAADEVIVKGTVADLAAKLDAAPSDNAGLLLVGALAEQRYRREWGALQGQRILLTCSAALLARAERSVREFGGIPLPLPLIRLEGATAAPESLHRIADFDWIVLTSPSAVRCFRAALRAAELDLRRLPRLAVCGPGTAGELRAAGLIPDCEPPAEFGAAGLVRELAARAQPGSRILRYRSDAAGTDLADALRAAGMIVEDRVLYRNAPVVYPALPACDAVVFASGSAVAQFIRLWGSAALRHKTVAAIGAPTAAALRRHGCEADTLPAAATIETCIESLAARAVQQALETLACEQGV
jgi:uroporphyrinogen III methyltransferase/synthase